jgi:hypothetical protein
MNFEKLLWGSLFLIKLSICKYFIWKFWCMGRHPLDGINIKQFGKYLKNQKPTLCSSRAHQSATRLPCSHRTSITSCTTGSAAHHLRTSCTPRAGSLLESHPAPFAIRSHAPISGLFFLSAVKSSPPHLFSFARGHRRAAVLLSFSLFDSVSLSPNRPRLSLRRSRHLRPSEHRRAGSSHHLHVAPPLGWVPDPPHLTRLTPCSSKVMEGQTLWQLRRWWAHSGSASGTCQCALPRLGRPGRIAGHTAQ